MKINKYPDGTSYVSINRDNVPNNIITFRINTYENLWQLNALVDAWNNTYNTKPTIIIPNLIDAQADRRFNDNESSGLKLVCSFLNGLNANFKIFHPHNQEVVEAMMDNVEIIDNLIFINTVLSKLDISNLTLMSSDAGGFKPLAKLCDKLNWKGGMYSAVKSRSWSLDGGTKFIQEIDKADFQGKDVLIIDDISIYGGTFKGLSKLLKERNCGKIYLAVSHMTVQNQGKDPVTNYFDKVFTTNSKFDEYTSTETLNLEIINLFKNDL